MQCSLISPASLERLGTSVKTKDTNEPEKAIHTLLAERAGKPEMIAWGSCGQHKLWMGLGGQGFLCSWAVWFSNHSWAILPKQVLCKLGIRKCSLKGVTLALQHMLGYK